MIWVFFGENEKKLLKKKKKRKDAMDIEKVEGKESTVALWADSPSFFFNFNLSFFRRGHSA